MRLTKEIINEFSDIYNEYNNEEGLKIRQALKKTIYGLPQYTEVQKDILWKMILARSDKDLRVKIK